MSGHLSALEYLDDAHAAAAARARRVGEVIHISGADAVNGALGWLYPQKLARGGDVPGFG